MNESDLRLLKASQDKLLRIYCRDGEILVARVSYVWDEYADVTYDVVSSNQEAKYKEHGRRAAYTVRFQDIESVEPVPEPQGENQ